MVLSNRQQPQSKEQEQVAAVAAAAEQQNDNGKENKKMNEFSRKKGNHIDQMLDRWKCSSARVGVAAGWVIIKRTF